MFTKSQLGELGEENVLVVSNDSSSGSVIVEGLTLANVLPQAVSVDLVVVRGGVEFYLLSDKTIPSGNMLLPFAHSYSPLNLQPGD